VTGAVTAGGRAVNGRPAKPRVGLRVSGRRAIGAALSAAFLAFVIPQAVRDLRAERPVD